MTNLRHLSRPAIRRCPRPECRDPEAALLRGEGPHASHFAKRQRRPVTGTILL